MADNINVTPGTGATVAADDIGGALHQRVKVVIGADGTSNGDVSATNPMPVGLYDSAGNGITSFVDPVDGERHLSVATIQDINTSTANSSTTNLASSASFTGTSVATDSVNSIAVTIFSDQPCNVSIQQSINGTNWDVLSERATLAGVGQFRIVQVAAAFMRVVVTNIGLAATTTFRLQTRLLPISQPNPAPLQNNRLVTGTITTACADVNINACPTTAAVVINTEGAGTVIAQHNAGWTGVVVFDVSYDNGLTWEMQSSIDISVNALSDNLRYFIKWSQTRIADRWAINCSGAQLVRLRAVSLTSGTIPVILTASPQVFYTNSVTRRNPTYSASPSGIAFAAAATATDIATLTGSATKTIKVFNAGFSGIQTTGDIENVTLIKRSTANTGGTSAAMSIIPFDSQDGAASATALIYTANPTLGTSLGALRASKVTVPSTTVGTTSSAQCEKIWNFEGPDGTFKKPLYLRGTSEVLCINLNGATFAGNSISCFFEWTEE